jgi:hypothetical protein
MPENQPKFDAYQKDTHLIQRVTMGKTRQMCQHCPHAAASPQKPSFAVGVACMQHGD